MNKNNTDTHPCYGMISISKVTSSNGEILFGSNVPCTNTIEIVIQQGCHERDAFVDSYGRNYESLVGNKENHGRLITVRMTPNQFSELITSFNQGDGVPCTIKQFDGEQIVQKMFEPRMQNIQEEFEKRLHNKMKDFIAQASNLRFIAKKGKPSKQDAIDMSIAFDSLIAEYKSNIPYMMECMRETVDKVSVEAKSEVEHWINKRITDAGIAALKANSQIAEDNDITVHRERIE